ncbi:hypothetical protein Pst134EA_002682 [Puccinia striiformis f. sp. tritici]|uniref:hypothetical protein n=1 Tax=Puccinia striiformis f. sp. tritici TaxID=168172 RepID=UPI002007792C|nr:hypothetical protein Pst134EA_002682 [Puccinia striiformis f. sp. tritici]KAH9472056.1 hypothetical protein Pst134EA_002682 [Puccinia striiformis f. sp. tritici]
MFKLGQLLLVACVLIAQAYAHNQKPASYEILPKVDVHLFDPDETPLTGARGQ